MNRRAKNKQKKAHSRDRVDAVSFVGGNAESFALKDVA
jgi:hypothetical protein